MKPCVKITCSYKNPSYNTSANVKMTRRLGVKGTNTKIYLFSLTLFFFLQNTWESPEINNNNNNNDN